MNAPLRAGISKEATALAQEATMLSPRFYTTDFAELDKTDVSAVRAQWDVLIQEMRDDPNKRHFVRNEEFDADFSNLPADLDKEFRDFLISSITAEFSGCVLYAEMKWLESHNAAPEDGVMLIAAWRYLGSMPDRTGKVGKTKPLGRKR